MSASLYLCVNLCTCRYIGVHTGTRVVNKWERNRGGAGRAGLPWDKREVLTTNLLTQLLAGDAVVTKGEMRRGRF